VKPLANGDLWIPFLGLSLGLRDLPCKHLPSPSLRWIDAEGRVLPSEIELRKDAESEWKRAEKELQRAEEEKEQERVARKRAEEERELADARIRELESELARAKRRPTR
jgi:hypothetical protein